MKNEAKKIPKINKILLIISVCLAAFFTAGTAVAFASSIPSRWFRHNDLTNIATIESWVKVTVTSVDSFNSDQVYLAEFTAKYWAEDNNYKLVLTDIDFYGPNDERDLDADDMWEYYDGADWPPLSGALHSILIPSVNSADFTADLSIRIKPDFFHYAGFAPYLAYNLELTAKLLPKN